MCAMKRKILIIVFILISIIIICSITFFNLNFTPTKYVDEEFNDISNISIDAKYNNSQNEIQYTIENNTKDTIWYGDEVVLERKINNKWYVENREVNFTAILLYTNPYDISEYTYSTIKYSFINLGEYRLIQEIYLDKNLDEKNILCAYFAIK